MTQDNPSPDMLKMRADAIRRMNDANEILEKSLGEIAEATQALTNSHASAQSEEGRKLYDELKSAQERYLVTFKRQKEAFDEAASYFEPDAT